MKRNAISGIILTLSLIGMLTLTHNVQPAKAEPSEPPEVEWSKTYGGTKAEDAHSVIETSHGGYIIAGFTYSFGAGMDDAWLIKTDELGGVEWNKTYGKASPDKVWSVVEAPDGGYAAVGSTYPVGKEYYDFWLIKTDAGGNLQWDKTFGGTGAASARSVQQTSDGGYIIGGGIVGSKPLPGANWDIWLIKTDVAGNLQWSEVYGGAKYDSASWVIQTADGGYLIAGGTYSFGAGSEDVWLIKTDELGNAEWNKTYGGSDLDSASCVVETFDGGYIVGGTSYSFGPGEYGDFWLIKIDDLGYMQWNKTYGGAIAQTASSVQPTFDGGYIIGGSTESFGAGKTDVWVVKTDANGNLEWNKTFGGPGYEFGKQVLQTSDRGYLILGSTNSFGAGENDIWLIKLEAPPLPSATTATVEINPDAFNLKSRGRWITCYIELPEGRNVSDIDIYSIRLNDTFPVSLLPNPPVPVPTEIGDYDNDAIPDLMVKFNRQDLIAILGVGEATLTITGKVNETPFRGSDTIRVLSKG